MKRELDNSLRGLLSSYSTFDISQFDIPRLKKNKRCQ